MDKKVIREIKKLEAFKDAERPDPATVISRLRHSVILSYGGEGLVIPPRGRQKIANRKLLGAIPTGVIVA